MATVDLGEIEFWRSGEWTMVYHNGELVMAGDHYHADDWLQGLCGVTVVEDDAGVCIPDGRNAIKTLTEVKRREDERLVRLREASEKRQAAEELLAEAARLEGAR